MIMRELNRFLLAVQFLTAVPVPRQTQLDDDWLPRSAKYFPLIGAMIGVVAGVVALVTSAFVPEPVPMVLGLAIVTVLTGALHEDGLADSADGLFGGRDRARRLEIMKDSRVGNYGVLALLICFALKGAALLSLDQMSIARLLIASLAASRLAVVLTMASLAYAGDPQDSKIKLSPQNISGNELLIAIVLGLLPGLLVLRVPTFAWASLIAAAVALCVALLARRRIGGYTGDVLGAVEQIYQATFLVVAAAVINGPG